MYLKKNKTKFQINKATNKQTPKATKSYTDAVDGNKSYIILGSNSLYMDSILVTWKQVD